MKLALEQRRSLDTTTATPKERAEDIIYTLHTHTFFQIYLFVHFLPDEVSVSPSLVKWRLSCILLVSELTATLFCLPEAFPCCPAGLFTACLPIRSPRPTPRRVAGTVVGASAEGCRCRGRVRGGWSCLEAVASVVTPRPRPSMVLLFAAWLWPANVEFLILSATPVVKCLFTQQLTACVNNTGSYYYFVFSVVARAHILLVKVLQVCVRWIDTPIKTNTLSRKFVTPRWQRFVEIRLTCYNRCAALKPKFTPTKKVSWTQTGRCKSETKCIKSNCRKET